MSSLDALNNLGCN